jgi:hypothetical protein
MRRSARILPFILGVWLLGVTLLRSFELPNEFAKAHWLIDYRFGFIKRGFIGSILSILSRFGVISRSENTIIVLSFAGIIMLYAMFFLVAWRIFKQTSWDTYSHWVLYVLVISPFVVTSGHFFGYFDAIIIIISFACVWLIIHRRIALCSLLTIIALLIHENFLVIGLPLMLFAMYSVRSNYDFSSKKISYPVFTTVITFLVIFISESVFIDRNQLRINLEAQFLNSGFVGGDWPRLIAMWITTSMLEYLRDQIYVFYARIFNIHTTVMILPSVLTMLLFIRERFKIPHQSKMMLYAVCTTCTPLLLHLVAWDTQRISAYTIVTAFGCVWICAETLPARSPAARPSLYAQLLIGSALVATCFMRLPLMNGRVDGVSMGVRIGLYAPVFMTLLFYYLRWNRQQLSSS